VTPFLLERMHAVTGGESVRANVALLRHNAQVAAALAVAGA
jgi:pseudouridylate synthase